MMANIDYSKLRGEMVAHGYTQLTLADAIGIGYRTLNRKLNSRVPFNEREIMAICKTLEIPLENVAAYFF